MTALLGLLAVAGYQNRDKIAEMLGGLRQGAPAGSGPGQGGGVGGPQSGAMASGGMASGGTTSGGMAGVLERLGGALGGASAGGILSGGLNELIERFNQSGHGDTAQSWVRSGPNQPVAPNQIEQAVGPEVLDTLSNRTGLSREELLARLARELPDAVDKYTPQGRLPTEADFQRS